MQHAVVEFLSWQSGSVQQLMKQVPDRVALLYSCAFFATGVEVVEKKKKNVFFVVS